MKHLKLASIIFGLVALFCFGQNALASPYGEGSYGSCEYSRDCPTTSQPGGGGSSGGSGTSTTAEPGVILLNDFSEYFAGVGKELTLSPGQVIYVDINNDGVTERHSITIKEVGADYVIVVIASDPIEVRFELGDVKKFDLSDDNEDDIEIKLISISNGKATFNFRALSATVQPTPITSTPTEAEPTISSNLIVLGLSALALLSALIIFFLLWKRRKDRKDQNITSTTK